MTPRKRQGFSDKHWHLDKKVPLALILTMALQTTAVVWWASSLTERVSVLEKRVETTAPQAERLTRVEVKIEAVQSDVSEIKSDIKRALRK